MVDVKRYEGDEKEINTLVKSGKFVANDIGICFGIEKCSILVLRREKKTLCEDIVLENVSLPMRLIRSITFLGIIERDDISDNEIKGRRRREYFKVACVVNVKLFFYGLILL